MVEEIANFNFYNPVKVIFGKNRIEELPTLIPEDKKVLITYGGGSVKRFGTLDRVKEALVDYDIGEFGGIEANPTYETCMLAVEKIKEEGYEFLLAVGGGSVIDGTKFIAAAAKFDGDPIDIFGNGVGQKLPIQSALPLGTILTLPATASEMNATSVITFKEKQAKVSFKSPKVFPAFSILEPELTYTLPKRQLANGISDAFVHIVENYITYPVGGMVQDRFSESLLKTLIEIGPEVVKEDNHDYNLRANFMWTASIALNGWLSVGVPGDWSTHALGHEITVLNNTDHARSLTAVLPALLHVRRKQKQDKLIQYAERVFGITEGTDDEKVDAAIQNTVDFFKSIDMPTSLAEVDVAEGDIDFLVNQLEVHEKVNISERQDQTADIHREIYKTALDNSFLNA
ncbi:MAG TPA: iron-containing alcohol dehydrogenase [Atopostipes sp.]|nr:iron-containing alcohol dehydrogenase [Atopostipes sp.]